MGSSDNAIHGAALVITVLPQCIVVHMRGSYIRLSKESSPPSEQPAQWSVVPPHRRVVGTAIATHRTVRKVLGEYD